MKPEMNHRERIMAAINHKPTDRVPVDYWGVDEITDKLMQYFNVKNGGLTHISRKRGAEACLRAPLAFTISKPLYV